MFQAWHTLLDEGLPQVNAASKSLAAGAKSRFLN